jgi:hypothetical protein
MPRGSPRLWLSARPTGAPPTLLNLQHGRRLLLPSTASASPSLSASRKCRVCPQQALPRPSGSGCSDNSSRSFPATAAYASPLAEPPAAPLWRSAFPSPRFSVGRCVYLAVRSPAAGRSTLDLEFSDCKVEGRRKDGHAHGGDRFFVGTRVAALGRTSDVFFSFLVSLSYVGPYRECNYTYTWLNGRPGPM